MIKIFLFLYLVPSFTQAKLNGPMFAPEEIGCLAFANLTNGSETQIFGENCGVRTRPCSTFKIALAEIAFNNQKINSKGEHFKWDGIKRDRDALNKDQDIYSWMKDSVVWVSSIIVDRLGLEKTQSELNELKYGNALVGPNEFWIKGPLAISVNEQVLYLSRQSKNENLLKAIGTLPIDKVDEFEVSGKTGSCFSTNKNDVSEIGWFIGRAKSNQRNYAFALRFIKNKKNKINTPAGVRAKELFFEWLNQQ